MNMGNIPNEAIAGTLVGVPAFWLFLKQVVLKSTSESASTSAENAKIDVITMLRDEVRRMGEINNQLATGLNELQIENVKLRKEISDLHNTINKMTEQLNIISRSNGG